MQDSRLDACGWSSFRQELFINEPGRVAREVGPQVATVLDKFSPGRRVLELCSGTGRQLIALAHRGYSTVGVDLSREMLEVCRSRLRQEPERVRRCVELIHADICGFALDRTFDAVILEDDGFGYLLTRADQIACLNAVRDHLDERGVFLLCNKTPQIELSATEQYEYDAAQQVKVSRCAWTVVDDHGRRSVVKEGFERRRLTYPDELEQLLTNAGLRVLHRWGDLHMTPFTDPAEHEYCYLMDRDGP